jgi:site-specific DNA recombinase
MQGHARGDALYACCLARDLVPEQLPDHPKSVYLRQDTIVPTLDAWLTGLFAPDRLEETTGLLLAQAAPSLAATTLQGTRRRRVDDAERKLRQCKAALVGGGDPTHLIGWINEASTELAAAQAQLLLLDESEDVATEDALRAVVADVRAVAHRLRDADPALKAELYRSLGLLVVYDPVTSVAEVEMSTLEACVEQGVRGGT